MGISIEEARLRVASANPSLSSAEIRQQADSMVAKLEAIEFEDQARASFAAQAAQDQLERAKAAQDRQSAYEDAAGIVKASHPGWGAESVEMEAQRLVAENESALAALALREALSE